LDGCSYCERAEEPKGLASSRSHYQDVRALNRGLSILENLAKFGWLKPRDLSLLTGIDRSSTYRLLHTLIGSGYVAKRSEDGSYALTAKTKTIGDGFMPSERASQIVAPHLRKLTQEISWPCDFAILSGYEVIIAESTHSLSPMTIYRAMVGRKRSLIRSALGHAILSAMREDELENTLTVIDQLGGPDSNIAKNRAIVGKIVREVRDRGYAAVVGLEDAKISAIALPVRAPNSVIGAVNVIFFRSAMTVAQAADRYLIKLRDCVDQIVLDISDEPLKDVKAPGRKRG
jgi:IclR family transcriptional regulator, mhp operon transcriptional activator